MEIKQTMIQVFSSIPVAGYSSTSKYRCINPDGLPSYYSNNSIDINLLECIEKEDFQFDKLD